MFIPKPFADSGDKTEVPNDQQADGSVNFTDGFGPFYELSLNPDANENNALPIRRSDMNWLLYLITNNIQNWQQFGLAPWLQEIADDTGYPSGAFVCYQDQSTGSVTPYRSLVDANKQVPSATATQWEEILTLETLLKYIPAPIGGWKTPGSGIITTAKDFDTIEVGTYFIASGAIAGSSANNPFSAFHISGAQCMIVVNSATDSSGAIATGTIQTVYPITADTSEINTLHYTSYIRSKELNGTYSSWAATPSVSQVQFAEYTNLGVKKTTDTDVDRYEENSPALNPAIDSIVAGQKFIIQIPAGNANTGIKAVLKISNAPEYELKSAEEGLLPAGTINGTDAQLMQIVFNGTYFIVQFISGAQAQIQNIGVTKQMVPTSLIINWPGATIPEGFLECNGATINKGTFPSLVNILNPGQDTAALPDLRGEFVRGYDNGKGTDPGRVLGSSQDQSFQAHNHTGTCETNGAHVHAVTIDVGGAHTHTGLVDSNGDHQHQAGPGAPGAQWGSFTSGSDNDYDYGAYFTSVNGAHQHTYTTPAGGEHAHTGSTVTAGDHAHSFTTDGGTGADAETRPLNVALFYIIKAA